MIRNENRKVLNLEVNEDMLIGQGFYSRVYRIDKDTCFKKFKNPVKDSTFKRLEQQSRDYETRKVIEAIKRIENPNLYQIHDLCFDKLKFIGYTMRYYEPADIMTLNRRYILINYLNVLELFDTLSNRGIVLSDLHQDNLLFTKEGMVIIDCDDAYIGAEPSVAMRSNIELFKDALKDKIFSGSIHNHCFNDDARRVIESIDYMDGFDSDEPILIKR